MAPVKHNMLLGYPLERISMNKKWSTWIDIISFHSLPSQSCLLLSCFVLFISFSWWWSFPFRRGDVALFFSLAFFHPQRTQRSDREAGSYNFRTGHANSFFKTSLFSSSCFACFFWGLIFCHTSSFPLPAFIILFYGLLYTLCKHSVNQRLLQRTSNQVRSPGPCS